MIRRGARGRRKKQQKSPPRTAPFNATSAHSSSLADTCCAAIPRAFNAAAAHVPQRPARLVQSANSARSQLPPGLKSVQYPANRLPRRVPRPRPAFQRASGSRATKQLARIAGTRPNPVVSFRFF
jgi:hypothetical protein